MQNLQTDNVNSCHFGLDCMHVIRQDSTVVVGNRSTYFLLSNEHLGKKTNIAPSFTHACARTRYRYTVLSYRVFWISGWWFSGDPHRYDTSYWKNSFSQTVEWVNFITLNFGYEPIFPIRTMGYKFWTAFSTKYTYHSKLWIFTSTS